MAKKRLPATAPKEDQPPSAAIKDDEKPSSPHPEEDKVEEQEDEDSSASSSSEAEDDDEEDESPSKNTTPPATNSHLNPKTEDDSDSGEEDEGEEDEEETDSDSEEEPAPKLKSLNSNSKPIDQIKSKAEPKPSAPPARSGTGTKRPADNDPKQAKKRKTAEKEPEEDNKNKKSGDDSKRFQRVFNDDDEMVIMKGLYDFITETKNDPFKYHTAFYDFVKKSFYAKVTLEQVRDKMRRLRKKYVRQTKSAKTPNFSKQNDRIMFEYGQKIWGEAAEEMGKPNGKLSKREPAAKKPRTTKKLVLEPDSPMVVKETPRKVERTDRENVDPSLALNELIRFEESISGESSGAMKWGEELMEESEREELKKRWEKVRIAELEVLKMKADLAVDQAMLILDALKSSSSD